jgi:hypothetical protein
MPHFPGRERLIGQRPRDEEIAAALDRCLLSSTFRI